MKKILLLVYLITLSTFVHAAAPTRSYTYTSGEIISSSEVTANEDNIYNYLQAGVDTYKDATILNADVSASANIQSDKLNLNSISQDVRINSGYTFDSDGTTNLGGTVNLNTKMTAADNEIEGTNFDINGGSIDDTTLGGTTSVTITDMDCNGGTLDGVNIGATEATGELIVNDSSDNANGLGSQGTSGQVLKSLGSGSNPTWTDMPKSTVAFEWYGSDSATTNVYGLYQGSSLTPTLSSTGFEYVYFGVYGNTYRTILRSKYVHSDLVSSVTINARLWTNDVQEDHDTILNVDIGGLSNTVATTWITTPTSPTWVTSANIDISTLTDGQEYDITIQLKSLTFNASAYCSAIVITVNG